MGFEICTDLNFNDFAKEKPRNQKMKLAYKIVKIYHGEKKAKEAQKNFVNTFQKKEIPKTMEEIKCKIGELLSEVLVRNKILVSKGEWRRLIAGNAIHDLDKQENLTDENIKISENLTLKIGKKRFIKVLVK